MANPFLFEDEIDTAPGAVDIDVSNPFFSDEPAQYDGENPFLCAENNPFAMEAEPDINNTVVDYQQNIFTATTTHQPMDYTQDVFYGGTVTEANLIGGGGGGGDKENQYHDNNIMFNSNISGGGDLMDDPLKQRPPPPRPTPPNKMAQDLISTLSDQLDVTSSKLLEQIPVTRTPSPVSMRDLHSPSPTPDIVDDLLGADNPFGVEEPPPTAVVQQQSAPQEVDMLDLFGSEQPAAPTRPPPPKTKDDILSLFNTSAKPVEQQQQQQQPDLLSDDILISTEAPVLIEQAAPIVNVATQQQQQQEQQQQDQQPFFESTPTPMIATDNLIPDDTAETAANQPTDILLDTTSQTIPTPTVTEPEPVTVVEDSTPMTIVDNTADTLIEPTNRYELCVSPSAEPYVSSADISEAASDPFPHSPSARSINEDISSPGSGNNPFMDTSEPVEAVDVNDPFGLGSQQQQQPAVPVAPEPKVAPSVPTRVPPPRPQPIVTPQRVVSPVAPAPAPVTTSSYADSLFGTTPAASLQPDEFDVFAQKFEESRSKRNSLTDTSFGGPAAVTGDADAWGSGNDTATAGFGDDGGGFGFDADDNFATMDIKPEDLSDEEKDISVVIRPLDGTQVWSGVTPSLAPPPRPAPMQHTSDGMPNPFGNAMAPQSLNIAKEQPQIPLTDSQASTPLYDEDVSQPLEDFPRIHYVGDGWEMQLRSPKTKKMMTSQRFWKKIWVRLVFVNGTPVVQLSNSKEDKSTFQELPLQPLYSVSEVGAQQYDQYGKIFTIKIQYVFYKERPGIRKGQVQKAERITSKFSKFAAYAIQGDYEGVKEFGSDLKKLGLPVEHAPQVQQLLKLGSMNFEDLKQFSMCVEEALFRMPIARERALVYKTEEIQVTAVDEFYAEQELNGHVSRQIARVRIFFLAFLTGMPTIELGVNDVWRQGKEVVGRHDIIPVATEEWIRLEGVEFHSCIQKDEYEKSRTLRFKPPDACYIELIRFRVRPPKNRELPLQLKAQWVIMGKKIELRADILVPGFISRKLGQIPCEDVVVRFPIPECWIYMFRVEKHFRYGSVKSAHRRTGKVKGIERILGAVETLQESLIEVTSGQAKYEHHHRALVWRCPRLPKEGQGAYTQHQLVCRMALTSYDQMPEELARYAYVEFTMPHTQVSRTTVRSVSVQDSDADEPPEKCVRHLARHEYRVEIEKTTGDPLNPYLAATATTKPATVQEEPETKPAAPSESESDSD